MDTKKKNGLNIQLLKWVLPGILIIVGIFGLTACSAGASDDISTAESDELTVQLAAEEVDRDLGTTFTGETEIAASETLDLEMTNEVLNTGTIDEIEAAGLLFMREEEKLARDVYLTLYETWNLPIFKNIAASEQSHTDAVKAVLSRYGLPDPVEVDEPGVFVNSDLQILYDELVERGRQSLVEALQVGAAIEEIDILDLEQRLAQTDEGAIESVYETLLKGSHNHLRAFVAQLEAQSGEAYLPQYLPVSEYEAIVLASAGQGGRGGRGGNGRNGRNG